MPSAAKGKSSDPPLSNKPAASQAFNSLHEFSCPALADSYDAAMAHMNSPGPFKSPVASATGVRPFFLLLHVNDNTDDQVIFQAACKRARVPVNWHVTDCARKGISYLQTLVKQSKAHEVHWPDLVLLDIAMPGESGFEVLKFVRATPEIQDTPVIIFTGHDEPTLKAEASRLGANSFFIKPSVFDKTVEIAKQIYAFCTQTPPPGASAPQQKT
jgi:CheY-like chemotaxis protein